MEGTAHRSLLEVDGLSYWPCKVLSPDAVPEPGTPRRVTVLTSWAVSDTLSLRARLVSPVRLAGRSQERHLWTLVLVWHVTCMAWRKIYTATRSIRQEGQEGMAIQVPVLIVDGNPSMTAMLQRFLTRQQVDAQAVLSPAEAQAVLAQQAFRTVLTDYFAPSGDGLILVRHLRQTVPSTRAILMAAFGAPELCHTALAEGAYACLAKPFKLQDLWAVVQPALQGLPAPAVSGRYGQGGSGQHPGGC